MKITLICDVLGEPNNGTSIAAFNLMNTLKRNGHEVRVVCPDECYRGKEGFYIVKTRVFGKWLSNYIKRNGVSLALPDIKTIDEACHDVDIIHGFLPFTLSHTASIYAKEHNIPFTCGFHCQAENFTNHILMMNGKIANALTYRYFWNNVYKNCDGIHYPTKFICDYVKPFGIKAPNEYVISNGVTKQFIPTFSEKPQWLKDKFVILMCGRLSREKNQKLLIKAIKKCKHKSDIHVILAGEGPQKKHLIKMVEKLKLDNVTFDFIPHENLINVLGYIDLYVHTSIVEIEAISCLEAICVGKVPLISDSKKSATSKFALIPESHFKSNSVKDLSKKIDWWFEHPERIKEVAPLYADFGQQFDYDSCMDRMEEMLLDVLKKHEAKK